MLRSGFQAPHHVLTRFVAGMTGYTPSDADSFNESTSGAELEEPPRFDFTKLRQHGVDKTRPSESALFRQIAGCVFDYIFHGDPRSQLTLVDTKLVEYGVARFGHNKNFICDEPLALLAVAKYYTEETQWNLPYFLNEGVSGSNASARGVAIEYFGAYALALAFRSPTRLRDVFDFVGDNDLKNETGHLVAVHKEDKCFKIHPFDISSPSLPTYILGRKYGSSKETLDWLDDPNRVVFCFPGQNVGPDLILVLQLSDGHLLRVVVQFKHSMTNQDSQKTIHTLASTNPRKLNSRANPRTGMLYCSFDYLMSHAQVQCHIPV
jgi:hypothetical protein